MMNPYVYKAKVARVVDGDTLDLDIDLGFRLTHRIRVRLLDVDTPEKYGPNACEEGEEASAFTESLCPVGMDVRVETHKTGKYGRWLAVIHRPDNSVLNQILKERYGGSE